MTQTPTDHNTAGGHSPTTWALLLAKWVELAKASVAIPEGEPDRSPWKHSVEHVISLQATTCALGEAASLDLEERALAADRASVAITKAARALSDAWAGQPMPESLLEMLADARLARDTAASLSLHVNVNTDEADAPDPWPLAHALAEAGFRGDLLAAPRGTRLFRGAPIAVATPEPHDEHARAIAEHYRPIAEPASQARPPAQLYRVIGESGKAERDTIAPMLTDLPAGAPLLMPVITAGRVAPEPSEQADAVRLERQRVALSTGKPLEVTAADASTQPASPAP
jgi:hypothetical protein